MIVDTSAVLAILKREPDEDRYATAILAAAPRRMPVANVLEAAIVVESRGEPEAEKRAVGIRPWFFSPAVRKRSGQGCC